MEIIKIDFEKVKISLTHDDMEALEINCDMLDGMDPKGRIAFNRILDEAKEKCGFITYGKRLFVQLFPSKDGGCEMFVTKLGNSSEKRFTVTKRPHINCYMFKNINDLVMFCRSTIHRTDIDVSELYLDEARKIYYICLDRDIQMISEFNGKKCIANSDVYVKEHFRLVTENAIDILSRI